MPNLVPMGSYKTPLRRVEKGHGFYGVVMGTEDGKGIQCHLCGKTFSYLPPHLYWSHEKVKTKAYKKEFMLASRTSLASEKTREKLIETHQGNGKQLQEGIRKAIARMGAKQFYAKNRHNDWRMSLEDKNKRGVCIDQLKERILDLKDQLGRMPSSTDMRNYDRPTLERLTRQFGGWTAALRFYHITPGPRNSAKTRHIHSKEELLAHLVRFKQMYGRAPSYSDARRKLIPDHGNYQYHFGGITKARRLAGL